MPHLFLPQHLHTLSKALSFTNTALLIRPHTHSASLTHTTSYSHCHFLSLTHPTSSQPNVISNEDVDYVVCGDGVVTSQTVVTRPVCSVPHALLIHPHPRLQCCPMLALPPICSVAIHDTSQRPRKGFCAIMGPVKMPANCRLLIPPKSVT